MEYKMNKINLINISQKLNIGDNIIKKINFAPIEDTLELSSKEQKHIEAITQRLSEIVDFDEMASKLLQSKLYGSAYNFIDFTFDKTKKIHKVNIGLYNRETEKVDETIVPPNVFIDIITNLTAQQIQKKPEQEKYYKNVYLKLLKHIEANKIFKNDLL